MSTKETKTKSLHVRMTPKEHKAFDKRAEPYGGMSTVARELVTAFTENRVTITPNPKKRSLT